MKKLLAALCVLLACLVSGCAKGVITLEVTRLGAADVTCRLTALPILQPTAQTFEEDFRKDGYQVRPVDDGDYKGFEAHKHFNQLKDIKKSKVLRTFNFKTWEEGARGALGQADTGNGINPDAKGATNDVRPKLPDKEEKPIVTMHSGLLFDTIDVNTTMALESKESVKDENVKAVLKNLMSQFDLRFVLKLPTRVDQSNATKVSDDGRVLVWKIPMGEDTPLQASVTYLNPVKAAGWVVVLLVIGGVAAAYSRKLRRQKALEEWTKKQEKSDHILPLPEEQIDDNSEKDAHKDEKL
ncbi:MAG: hypothetical protein LKE33_03530 [Acidaminococcus sp.]|jgi:hypothetical protein|nr:hypothetical protein [Acidaminococcus sp.]MCI2100504.1 hypothetical protein [Acidaminococcus sp.]MCI2114835.1 hypothetical protein [Acidaminococcus sp.]MCI2116878.1 hypothetical protein [Acidaminococcus sp.]